jgi:pentatricopeptide repeat protein
MLSCKVVLRRKKVCRTIFNEVQHGKRISTTIPFTIEQISPNEDFKINRNKTKRIKNKEVRIELPTVESGPLTKNGATTPRPPIKNSYLRVALLCKSGNLEKVKELYTEIKDNCNESILQEIIQLYAKNQMAQQIADIVIDAHNDVKKTPFPFFHLIEPDQVLVIFNILQNKIPMNIEHYYNCMKVLFQARRFDDMKILASRIPSHPLIETFLFHASLETEYNDFQEALVAMNTRQLFFSAKHVNLLYEQFGNQISLPVVRYIFSLKIDLRNLTPKLINSSIESLLKEGDTLTLMNILESMIVKNKNFPKEFFIDILDLMIKKQHLRGVETCVYFLTSMGIIPSSDAYNYLLKAYLYTKRLNHFHSMLNHMRSTGVEFNATTYNLMLEDKYFSDDVTGSIELVKRMNNLGIIPTKFGYRIVTKLCVKHNLEELLISNINEGVKRGLPMDIYGCNALLTLYCNTGNEEKINKTRELMIDLRIDANAATFSRLINFYGRKGDLDKVKGFLSEMESQQIEPDRATNFYVSKYLYNFADRDPTALAEKEEILAEMPVLKERKKKRRVATEDVALGTVLVDLVDVESDDSFYESDGYPTDE